MYNCVVGKSNKSLYKLYTGNTFMQHFNNET